MAKIEEAGWEEKVGMVTIAMLKFMTAAGKIITLQFAACVPERNTTSKSIKPSNMVTKTRTFKPSLLTKLFTQLAQSRKIFFTITIPLKIYCFVIID